MDKATSRTLLERARNKDGDAWWRLIELYSPLVAHWCGHGGIRGLHAEDIIQQVFQAVALNLDEFRRDRPGDTFRGWLRVITRNKLLDHFRSLEKQPLALSVFTALDVDTPIGRVGGRDLDDFHGTAVYCRLRRQKDARTEVKQVGTRKGFGTGKPRHFHHFLKLFGQKEMVGATGFEPATSWSQTKCSSQAELRSGIGDDSVAEVRPQRNGNIGVAPAQGAWRNSSFG